MKTKKTMLIIFFVACSWIAYGQQQWSVTSSTKSDSRKFSLYVEAGFNVSSYRSNDDLVAPNFSSSVGVVLGGGANLCFIDKVFLANDKLSGQIGLLYTRTGFSSEEEKVRGNYLCVPLSIQYYPISHLYAELILQPCLNIGLSPTIANIEGFSINLEGHKANDFKIGFGVGYILNSIPIGVSFRYLIGTSDFAENLLWRGNLFQFGVFYQIKI